MQLKVKTAKSDCPVVPADDPLEDIDEPDLDECLEEEEEDE